jgi:hypothetical protein
MHPTAMAQVAQFLSPWGATMVQSFSFIQKKRLLQVPNYHQWISFPRPNRYHSLNHNLNHKDRQIKRSHLSPISPI